MGEGRGRYIINFLNRHWRTPRFSKTTYLSLIINVKQILGSAPYIQILLLCAMLTDIPKIIGGAKTLIVAKYDTGFGTVLRDEKEIVIEF